jgi:predicted amidophosphoribosyltransferase
VRRIVAAWKERGLRGLAGVASDTVAATIAPPRADAVTFVPADADRGSRRGHHPAEELARGVAAAWSLPVAPLLRRPRPLRPQRGLNVAERRRNVRGAFVARVSPQRRVLLVDDVYTTGATLNEAASALRRAGAREVHAVTFARAVR